MNVTLDSKLAAVAAQRLLAPDSKPASAPDSRLVPVAAAVAVAAHRLLAPDSKPGPGPDSKPGPGPDNKPDGMLPDSYYNNRVCVCASPGRWIENR